MSSEDVNPPPRTTWSPLQAYQLAVVCLALGVGLGVLIRSSVAMPRSSAKPAAPAVELSRPVSLAVDHRAGAVEQNQPAVAARAAGEVLAKLNADPNNFELLRQAGNIYLHSRVFPGAADFYRRALQVKEDANVRNDYASALFYGGDAEGALQQYETILKTDPKNTKALFNRGMVRWRGKQDPKGAVQSWKLLLKVSPKDSRRAQVEDLIAKATQHANRKP